MMTENNFFTHIQKWSVCKADTTEPPKFFRQSFDLAEKTIVPYDELSSWKNEEQLQNLIPHFFIEDYKQTCMIIVTPFLAPTTVFLLTVTLSSIMQVCF